MAELGSTGMRIAHASATTPSSRRGSARNETGPQDEAKRESMDRKSAAPPSRSRALVVAATVGRANLAVAARAAPPTVVAPAAAAVEAPAALDDGTAPVAPRAAPAPAPVVVVAAATAHAPAVAAAAPALAAVALVPLADAAAAPTGAVFLLLLSSAPPHPSSSPRQSEA